MTATAGQDHTLTVRQVLALDRLTAGEPEVVAGADHLDHPVRWVHVAEAADVGVMLTGGEMILTTGVLLADNPRTQTEYIESLHRAEASALVLGLGRAFPAPPQQMRRTAERYGLPMVVLHRPFPFAQLTEEVQSLLVRRKFAEVSLSEGIRTALTALITAGAPLQRLLDEVATYSGCPVLVTNLAHRVLATAGEHPAVDDVLRDWDRIARRPGEVDGEGWVRADLGGRGERWGSLVLCGHRGDEARARLLADRAAEALVLHRMLSGPTAVSWEEQSAHGLLADLVSGVVPARRLLPRARAAGLPVGRRTFVPLVVKDGDPEQLAKLLRLLGQPGLVAALDGQGTAILLSLARDQAAEPLVGHVAARLRAETGEPALVAAGPACATWDDVPDGLREALHVADAVTGTPPGLPDVVRLGDVRLRGLMRLLRDDPRVQSFAERELDALLDADACEDTAALLPVLRTYLATGRNKSRTAHAHHMSRPALYRRLEAIEALLGLDLDDFEQAASVHIALLAHDAQEA
ncbi:PucR family transcriptional regulator [Streptomyces beihaiensis]|uniref:PucR family transcriptional regulator ligand-binding domain-containing protein n=1 Tax=Streptomyces beihaiensis TaxID=2984495 RepID=A0ABT3U6C8_9ACTN|nr:PucR family transcriptional regulator ligand-binding domain-containing protein [Streptomyces beihaiensis]MCX3064167.1 PucR family transcriptional regulator ligand-binding domain-containing protein [Streptomyces beihaiensis]